MERGGSWLLFRAVVLSLCAEYSLQIWHKKNEAPAFGGRQMPKMNQKMHVCQNVAEIIFSASRELA